ncbi:MAG: hypothetical protein L7S46_04385 [Candidatus Poseidoniaceae archaeon]|nr:hypothetical protein [Candidatus Poseidoniaceae archaeon]
MASLWQFFGLPDPEAGQNAKRNEVQQPAVTPLATQQQITPKPIEKPQAPALIPEPVGVQPTRKEIPLGWQGPVTSDGEPFHDLGALHKATPVIPNRALRYVAPDVMNRIPTRGIAKRVNQGDTVIVDLRPLVHMDTHQNVCRRELKQMSDEVGVGVFALDAEDKLLLMPGNDVVVDVQSHELGLGALLNP